ncbi:hypothetical protein [Nitrosopumilus zosterae]|uniref:hypothetical protein n=2 Tax=Nitrosopumilus zosterae TaxID=718286 RepID=UPI000D6F437B|nr:hypothetical protein [Nitrosopumilus zosterae]BDQ30334.1 hypothetical protein NZOSNM25_000436 [Nitrosopumilus zosterae]
MRMDSCRKCGLGLETKQKCSMCMEPIKFSCKNCNFETDEQIHSICRLVDVNYKPPVYEVA